ncbi:MAG: hypothetical protein M1826_000125 [Phylliscum demangeonii]|nr:MAG: hypothetical protein M1826_000125 [Phylliscum demangeonii]
MKFLIYFFPVYAFIVGSVSLYIPPDELEHKPHEMARPNTPLTSADKTDKQVSWPVHVVEPRVQNLAMLAKRTTDEENPHSQEDVNQGTNARDGPVSFPSELLATYEEEYDAAKQASDNLQNKLKRAKEAGLEVSQDEVNELARLSAVTDLHREVLTRASLGRPLDRRTILGRKDVASLVQDPEMQDLVGPVVYDAQQLAGYKQSYLEAGVRFHAKKTELAKIAKVREVTKAEEKELADFKSAYNTQRNMWNRARAGKPTNYRVDPPRRSMDDLLESVKLHEIAQSSGYSVKELAEAYRKSLDSVNDVNACKRKLAEVEKVREVTPAEKAELQALLEAVKVQQRVFWRMKQGRPTHGPAYFPRKDLTSLLKDPEIQRIAQQGGYRVEEVAVQHRGYLDAIYEYREASKLVSAVKKKGGTLTPDEEARFLKIDHAYQLQKTAWDHMSKGERVDPAVQPPLKLGRLGNAAAALRPNADFDEVVHPVTYTPQQIAIYDQQHLEALDELRAAISAIELSGRSITNEEEKQLELLRNAYNQRSATWSNVRQSLPIDGLNNDRRLITYTAQEIEHYNRLHLEALSKLRASESQMAAARQAGHSPTPADEARYRALRDDFNKKKTAWTRARNGKPIDREVRIRRAAGSEPKSARSPEIPPGSQDHASQASPAKEDPSTRHQPLQVSGHLHLLAPVLSSAHRFLQGLGRQWRAMPWTRYLANPRLIKVQPAELLRAEPTI